MQAHLLAPPPVRAACRPATRVPFAFGRRFFLLLAIGIAWVIPAFWNARLLWIMLAWDLCTLAFWILDLLRLPQPSQIEIQRAWAGPPSLSNDVSVELEVTNSSSCPLHCRLVDDVPASLRTRPPQLVLKVRALSSGVSSYAVHPLQRGENSLGGAYLRYQSSAGFAERWARAEIPQTIRVFPDIEEARRHSIYMTRARQIEMEKRLIRQRGTGREFESLREYQPGDEFRNICWTATARRGKHVTRLFQVERSQPIWIVLDAGRLLRARVGELSKLDLSVNAALTVAQTALYSGDRVGLLVYGRRIQQRVGLGRGLPHMRAIMDALSMAQEEPGEADHLQAAAALMQLQRQRALILWITDLADTSMTPEVVESASQILSRHLLLFTVIAQTDLVSTAERYPETPEELFRNAAAQEMVYRRETLIGRVRNRGALALELAPSALTTAVVNQYLEIKARNMI